MVIAPFTRGDTVSVSFDRVALPTGERFTPLESDLTLILKGPSTLSKEALKEGAFWRLDLKTSDTDTLTAGRYSVYLRIKSSETVKTVAYGTTKVLPKPEDLDETHDPRSRAEKALEEAENALMNFKSGKRVQSYSIDGRSMTFTSTTDIISIVNYWRDRVRAERRGSRWLEKRGVQFQ